MKFWSHTKIYIKSVCKLWFVWVNITSAWSKPQLKQFLCPSVCQSSPTAVVILQSKTQFPHTRLLRCNATLYFNVTSINSILVTLNGLPNLFVYHYWKLFLWLIIIALCTRIAMQFHMLRLQPFLVYNVWLVQTIVLSCWMKWWVVYGLLLNKEMKYSATVCKWWRECLDQGQRWCHSIVLPFLWILPTFDILTRLRHQTMVRAILCIPKVNLC